MQPPRLDEDILSLTEFRSNVATLVKRVMETRRPLVLTQHGRGAVVVLDVQEFEAMRERIGLLEDLVRADQEFAEGRGIPHEEVAEQLRRRLSDER